MTGAWIEAFRAGKHTSSEGVVREYSGDDLEKIATTYNSQKDHEAPLVYGHPEHDKPAHGWIKELKVMGDRLWAFAECNEDARDAVAQKSFKKVSIALYPSGLLRHIGLLGSMPPAVKGLASVNFVDGDQTFEEYMWATDEYRVPTIGRLLSDLRDYFIEKFGIEDADKALDKESIASLQSSATGGYIPDAENQFKEEENMDETKLMEFMETMKIQIMEGVDAKIEALRTSFSEQIVSVSATVAALDTVAKKTTLEIAKEGFVLFCDGLIAEGKLLPAEKDSTVEMYSEWVQMESSMTFAEGIVRPSEKLKAQLSIRPANAPTKKVFASKDNAAGNVTVATAFHEKDVNAQSVELDTKIRTYMETNKIESYEAACAAVMGSAN